MPDKREPTIEEMRAAWEATQARKAKKAAYYQRPEAKAKYRAQSKARYAELRRLAKLAREAGLG